MATNYFRCGTGVTEYYLEDSGGGRLEIDNASYSQYKTSTVALDIDYQSITPADGYTTPYKIYIYKDSSETTLDNSWTLSPTGDLEISTRTYNRYARIQATAISGKTIKIYKGVGLYKLYGTPYRNGVAGEKQEILTSGTEFINIPTGSSSNNYVLFSDIEYYSGYQNAWYYNTSSVKTYVSSDPKINMYNADRNVTVYTEDATTYYTITTETGTGVTSIAPSAVSIGAGTSQNFTATVAGSTTRWNEGSDSGGYDTQYRDDYNIYSGGWTIETGSGSFSSTAGKTTTFTPTSDAKIKATARASGTAIGYRNHIKYDANEGSGSMNKSYSATESSSGVYKAITVSSNSFTRQNYRFTSWNTKSDGTGTTYATGSRNINANVILYAQWKAEVGLFYWDAAEGNDDEAIFWNRSQNKGQPVTNLTAGNWNRFKALIKRMNDLEGKSWTYSTTTSGSQITAAEFNNVRTGINNLTGHGSLPSAASQGGTIYAKYFVPINSSNNLRDALNTAITYWNTH